MYSISSCGRPKRGCPPIWGLGEVLIISHRKKILYDETFKIASELDSVFGSNKSMEKGHELRHLECEEHV